MKNYYTVLRRMFLFILLFTFSASDVWSATKNSDIELLRKRFKTEIMSAPVDDERVMKIAESLRPDSTWEGIDYVDVSRIAFQHSRHLDNMVMLSRAYNKEDSKLRGNKKVKQAFDASLAFWIKHDFICENWWWNQIGTPGAMVSILYSMDKNLSPEQLKGILPIAGRAHMMASGARPSGDRIKIASMVAQVALFQRDEAEVENIIKIIEAEIQYNPSVKGDSRTLPGSNGTFFSGGRGMEADFSFHHRPDRVDNTVSYGLGYANAFAEWAANVSDTRYRFSDKSIKLLTDYYLDGICAHMVYGKTDDPGTVNRDIARKGGHGTAGTKALKELLVASDYRKAEIENIIKIRRGEPADIKPFAKFFWMTEYFVFQRPNFFTSVRMHSTRNANMEEPYNGEGLTNHYRGDGTNYLSLTGREYYNIAPVNDWRKIPGTTVMQMDSMPGENEVQKLGLTDFVGGVTDGLYGAAVFDFKSPHNPVSAKKSWFFFDNEYVCLGAGIKSFTANPVATTVNQCLLKGDVIVKDASGVNKLPNGEKALNETSWVFNNGVGYIFPETQKVSVMNATASGSWFTINRQTSTPKTTVTEDVFKLWIDHGAHVRDGAYSYIVMPAANQQSVEKAAQTPNVKILSNTDEIQAVSNPALGIAYAVFYCAGELKIADNAVVKMDSPGMIMVKYDNSGIRSISASDPSRKLGKMHLSISQNVNAAGDNFVATWSPSKSQTNIAIDLPSGVYGGSSVQVKLQ